MADDLTLTDPIDNFDLKDKSQEELLSLLVDSHHWNEEEKKLILSAYQLAAQVHAGQEYKGGPYIMHLLRVANRIPGYLHIHDAEVVAAGLLHDAVEDNAQGLSGLALDDAHQQQRAALEQIAKQLSPRVSALVSAVTNEPLADPKLTDDQKLAIYTAKVAQATATADGWIIKFSDWCDNGLGIAYGSQLLSDEEIARFQHKYGGEVLETYQRRFREPDVQAALDWAAKGYVEHQLKLGHERLDDYQE